MTKISFLIFKNILIINIQKKCILIKTSFVENNKKNKEIKT